MKEGEMMKKVDKLPQIPLTCEENDHWQGSMEQFIAGWGINEHEELD